MDLENALYEYGYLLEYADIFSLFVIILMFAEIGWDVFKKTGRGWKETAANFAIALGNIAIDRITYGLVFIIGLVLIAPYAFFEIPVNIWSWITAIIVADFTYYWMHRFEHEIRVLWTYHSVHHSSHEFNLSTGLRLAWWESFVEWMFFIPMVLVGFDLIQVLVGVVFVVTYQGWIHTEKIGKLGWLEGILNTPSVHRVHHGTNRDYIDKNYGGILIIWDRLFGTYQVEKEKVKYGVLPQIGTSNPIKINFYELGKLFKDVWRAKTWRERLRILINPPGWMS
ncbi:sterol desaturase family protein [Curvivirga sp.]|uniref:sterol desaturase family protein n=1 Tax=Curvivirga sp. TaxID=2856848 RepID=UPI003B5B21B7